MLRLPRRQRLHRPGLWDNAAAVHDEHHLTTILQWPELDDDPLGIPSVEAGQVHLALDVLSPLRPLLTSLVREWVERRFLLRGSDVHVPQRADPVRGKLRLG